MKRPPKKRYYTITEAAKELGITRQAVHGAIKRGLLEAQKGQITQVIQIRTVKRKLRGWLIPIKSLNAYRVSDLHQWVGKK